jgi:carboxypeptidase C (cathepsin A)
LRGKKLNGEVILLDLRIMCVPGKLAKRGLLALACSLSFVMSTANADAVAKPQRDVCTGPNACCREGETVVHHHMILRGQNVAYISRAGFLPIGDAQNAAPHGCMFYVAYITEHGRYRQARPLTFVWNGGPGASSSWLHFGAFGPRRIVTAALPTEVSRGPLRLGDNPSTLLDQGDLVFVDPIGTGFSRPTEDRYADEFYNVLADTASVAEFIRVYRAYFKASDQPLVLIGESYGVWRAAAVAEALAREGTPVAGMVLISGGFPVDAVMSAEQKVALAIPNRTAAAFYYKKLDADLSSDFAAVEQASRHWATETYAPALARAPELTAEERSRIVQGLSRFTGLKTAQIDARTLIVPRSKFIKLLLPGETLQSLDIRLTKPAQDNVERSALIGQYLRDDLRFRSDLEYLSVDDSGHTIGAGVADRSVNERWDYNQSPGESERKSGEVADPTRVAAIADANEGPGEHPPWLSVAWKLDPQLKVFVAAGWFDTWNSCVGNDYIVRHLAPAMQKNTTAKCYIAGHMIYRDAGPHAELREDLRRWFQQVGAREAGR